MEAIIAIERKRYHEQLLREGVLTIDRSGVPSNADRASKLSIAIASGIASRLMADTQEKAVGQTSGAKFEQLNMEFLRNTFPKLQHLRPGNWHIIKHPFVVISKISSRMLTSRLITANISI